MSDLPTIIIKILKLVVRDIVVGGLSLSVNTVIVHSNKSITAAEFKDKLNVIIENLRNNNCNIRAFGKYRIDNDNIVVLIPRDLVEKVGGMDDPYRYKFYRSVGNTLIARYYVPPAKPTRLERIIKRLTILIPY